MEKLEAEQMKVRNNIQYDKLDNKINKIRKELNKYWYKIDF